MWDRYTKNSNGVAIRTNAKRLLECIQFNLLSPIASDKDFCEESVNQTYARNMEGSTSYVHYGLIIKPIKYISDKPSDFKMHEKYLYSSYDKLCFFFKRIDYRDEKEVRILLSNTTNKKIHEMNENQIKKYISKSEEPDIEQIINRQKREQRTLLEAIIDKITENQIILPQPESRLLKIGCASKLIDKIVISPNTYNSFIDIVNDQIDNINLKRQTKNLPLLCMPNTQKAEIGDKKTFYSLRNIKCA